MNRCNRLEKKEIIRLQDGRQSPEEELPLPVTNRVKERKISDIVLIILSY